MILTVCVRAALSHEGCRALPKNAGNSPMACGFLQGRYLNVDTDDRTSGMAGYEQPVSGSFIALFGQILGKIRYFSANFGRFLVPFFR